MSSFVSVFRLLVASLFMLSGPSGCCRDAICRTDDPRKLAACCAERSPEENNCMACASQPSCGWCETPAAGEKNCQASTGETMPATCADGWSYHTGTGPGACPKPAMPPGGVE